MFKLLPAAAILLLAVTMGARTADAQAKQLEQRGTWSGTVVEIEVDDFTSGRSSRILAIRTGEEELVFLPESGAAPALRAGDRITVSGLRSGRTLSGNVVARQAAAASAACSPIGEQRVAAILITGQDPSTLPSPDEIRRHLFGPSPSLDAFWREASYGKTWATGDVFGWFKLSGYDGADPQKMYGAAMDAARRQADLSKYNRIFIYCTPEPGSINSPFSGLGTLGCSGGFSTTWIMVDRNWSLNESMRVSIHEGGHNLGLLHASGQEFGDEVVGAWENPGIHVDYNDPFSIMGGTNSLGQYNAPHKFALGWLTPAEVLDAEPGQTVRIAPLSSQAPGPKAVRIRRSADAVLWAEYRPRNGFFESTIPAAANSGAVLHYEDARNRTDGIWELESELLDFTPDAQTMNDKDVADAPLPVRKKWTDRWSPLGIEVLAAGRDGLSLRITSESCVTLSAASRTHAQGEDSGSVEVTAPADCRWTVASSQAWLVPESGAEGQGNGTVRYHLAPGEGQARDATLSIGGQSFSVSQAGARKSGLVKVAPGSGSGPGSFFTATFLDSTGGPTNLRTFDLAFNTAPKLDGGCVLRYDRPNYKLSLADQTGTTWLGPLNGSTGSANGNCQVVSADAFPGRGDLSARILFPSSGASELKIYGRAEDAATGWSPWAEVGRWSVTADRAPLAAAASPTAGAGRSQVFAFTFEDPDGAGDLENLQVKFGSCEIGLYLTFRRVWLGSRGTEIGAAETLSGSGCSLDVGGMRLIRSEKQLRVTLPVTFTGAGEMEISSSAQDYSKWSSAAAKWGVWKASPVAGAQPAITAQGVTNAASFAGGAVAPGEIVTIFGTNLGPAEVAQAQYDSGGYLANIAGNTRVFFNGVQAPMVYSSAGQVSAIAPYSISGSAKVRVEYEGRASNEVEVPVASAAPGIFRMGAGSQAVVVNAADNTFNSEANPATAGGIVTLFATGEGYTSPTGVDGLLPEAGRWPEPDSEVQVTFGGVPGEVLFSGLVYAGVLQINVKLPAGVPTGPNVPVQLSLGGIRSPEGTTVAVK